MRKTVLALLALLTAVPAWSETAVLLRDIRTVRDGSASSQPQQMTALGDRAVFVAGEPGSGAEVWASDGTPAGTTLLRDVCPGACSSGARILGVVGGLAFFTAQAGEGEPLRLWRTDGTRLGTVPVREAGGEPLTVGSEHAIFQGRLYLDACATVCGLWRTDGSEVGTVPVTPDLAIHGLAAASHQLFFTSDDGLWRSSGAPGGAARVAEILDTFPLVPAGNRVFFFSGSSSSDGRELWVSDGTTAGTRPLTDFAPFDPFPVYDHEAGQILKAAGDHVYFTANDVLHGHEIWRSDGTPQTTRRVTDFGFFEPFDQYTGNDDLWEVNGRLVFRATDGINGHKVWVTDGRPESTAPVKDICPGGCGFLHPFRNMILAGGRVYFVANDREHGYELWSTDGTAAGTRLARDICPGPCDEIQGLRTLNGAAFFLTRSSTTAPYNLWRSDGTLAGTRPLTSFTSFDERPGGFSFDAVAVGGRIFFTGASLYGEELWVTDARGARLVADIHRDEPGSDPLRLTPAGGRLFFGACRTARRSVWVTAGTPESTAEMAETTERCDDFPYEGQSAAAFGLYFFVSRVGDRPQLWVSDGTAAGTRVLTQLAAPSYLADLLGELDGRLSFLVQRETNVEIWSSDGTPAGTRLDVTLPGLYATWFPERVAAPAGAEAYFYGGNLDGDIGLWRTDGTAAGTRRLAGGLRLPEDPWYVRAGATVFFKAENQDAGNELWKTDGTPAGTMRVLGFPHAFGDHGLVDPVAFQGALYFFGYQGTTWALYRSDGTAAGTVPIAYFDPENEPGEAPRFHLATLGDRLLFAAGDEVHGVELWASDGTAAGTRLLKDILPGSASSMPRDLTAAGGRVFFAATDGVRGVELWSTTGIPGGTRMVQDLAPEALSSHPFRLTATANRLYFTADDGATGREIWALPLAGVDTCQPSPTRLCLGGRFQVEAVWRDFQGNAGTGKAVALSADTGYFWFFDPANVETIVKVLDGRGVNEHHWVFYGALSNVEFSLTVTDVTSGLARRYFNPINQFASVGDTRGFGPLGAFSRTDKALPSPLALVSERTDPAVAAAPCAPTATRLCLDGNRFAVEVTWKDFQGNTGTGKKVDLTADTGYFWFFDAANVELVLKVLDGTPVNGHHWVFYGALSNVEYRITVSDTATGAVKVYTNPSGRFASVGDTAAF